MAAAEPSPLILLFWALKQCRVFYDYLHHDGGTQPLLFSWWLLLLRRVRFIFIFILILSYFIFALSCHFFLFLPCPVFMCIACFVYFARPSHTSSLPPPSPSLSSSSSSYRRRRQSSIDWHIWIFFTVDSFSLQETLGSQFGRNNNKTSNKNLKKQTIINIFIFVLKKG